MTSLFFQPSVSSVAIDEMHTSSAGSESDLPSHKMLKPSEAEQITKSTSNVVVRPVKRRQHKMSIFFKLEVKVAQARTTHYPPAIGARIVNWNIYVEYPQFISSMLRTGGGCYLARELLNQICQGFKTVLFLHLTNDPAEVGSPVHVRVRRQFAP